MKKFKWGLLFFDEWLAQRMTPEPNSGCWIWLKAATAEGSGYFHDQKVVHPAHRYVYEKLKGPIPAGLQLRHACGMRCCVNPDHLEPVTRKKNPNYRRGRSPTAPLHQPGRIGERPW